MDDRRRQLALSAGDEQRVLEYCTDAERRTLTSGQTIYRETCVDDITVRETDDGYAALLNSKLVAVSMSDSCSRSPLWSKARRKPGTVVIGVPRYSYPFMVELSRFRPAVTSYRGYPNSRLQLDSASRISAGVDNRLLTLATLLSSPVVEHRQAAGMVRPLPDLLPAHVDDFRRQG